MRVLTSLAVAAMLTTTPALGDQVSDKKAFRDAYKAYQEAIASNENQRALEYAKQAYEFGEKVYGKNHKNTAALLLNYGYLIKNDDEARKILGEAVKRYEAVYGENSAELIDPLMSLASKSTSTGTLGRARKIYRRVLSLAETHYPDNARMEGVIRLEMGKVALQEAYSREAFKHLEQAKALLQTVEGDTALAQVAEADFYIGKYQMTKKDYKKAETALLDSLEVYEKHAPNARATMSTHAFLIRVYEEQGLRDQATKHCRAIGAKSPTKPNQDYMPVYRTYPVYPQNAQLSGSEGYAIVELTVNKDGFVSDPKVIDRKGHPGFDKASLDAVTNFRYAPRYENGEAVDTKGVKYRFTYNLR